jgi:putative ABC transport system permease protein
MRIWIVALALISCGVGVVQAQDLQGRTIVARSVAPKASGPATEAYGMTREDLRMIRSLVPSIQTLVPIRNIPKVFVRVGDQSTESAVTGTTADYTRGKSLEVVRGRFLTAADVANRNNVAVIDVDHANKLFADKDPIGKAIQFNKQYFTVVGVVETALRSTVFIPITTMRSRLGDTTTSRQAGAFEVTRYELSEIEVVPITKVDVDKTMEMIKRILRKNHSQQDYEVKVKP